MLFRNRFTIILFKMNQCLTRPLIPVSDPPVPVPFFCLPDTAIFGIDHTGSTLT